MQAEEDVMDSGGRGVVVLAGWLGCHPRNLRRFSEMYKKIGWDSLIRIASPRSVIEAMTEGPSSSSSQSLEIKNLAINTLQELQTLQPPCIIFHIFSNNGSFLWEWIRYLLFDEQESLSSSANIDVQCLSQKIIGVIFDSAPAYYDGKVHTLQSALDYVSPETERKHLLKVTKSLNPNIVRQRFRNFWNGMYNDLTNIPQLYLYSQCDELASAEHIDQLIVHRKDLVGKRKIWKHMFLNSDHCTHLLKYPEEYQGLVKCFVSFHIREGMYNHLSIRSKL